MNRDLTAVGQVWEDRKGRRRRVVGIVGDMDFDYRSVLEVPEDGVKGRTYRVVWEVPITRRARFDFCTTWEAWVEHATLIQEDS